MMRRTLLFTLTFLVMASVAGCQALGWKKETSSLNDPAAATESIATEPPVEQIDTQTSETDASTQIVPISKVKNHVNVRQSPDANSAIVGTLQPGEPASLVSKAQGWYQITLSNGTTGFVSQDWVQTVEEESAAAEAASSETVAKSAVEAPVATTSIDPAKMTEGVYFVKPRDGDVIEGPVVYVAMGVKGKELRPAGEIIPGTGHHHLIIDSEVIERGKLVPSKMEIMHFGNAETEVPVSLSKGKHKLTLQFTNGHHISYGEKWRRTIYITVK